MQLQDFIGQAATICTIAVFLSGTEICRKIWRNQSTKDISPYPFLCGLLSCSFWLRYGLLIDDTALIVVNMTGAVLQTMYLCWYCRYNSLQNIHSRRGICLLFNIQLLVVVLIIASFYILTTFCIAQENAQYVAGISACTAGVIFMASPLATVAHVIETKNADSLPFPLILSTFVMASLWVFYGYLKDDTFVQVPNALGAVLSFCQLTLFAIYRNPNQYNAALCPA